MWNPCLLKKSSNINRVKSRRLYQSNSGFTLIEMIAVVIIIAILSAIAAPGWLTFVNRQRVSKVNDVVLSSLQEAQREAKRTKYSYSVSFKKDGDIPQVAVYRSDITPNNWKNLTSEVGVNSNQVWVGTNIGNINTVAAGESVAVSTTPKTITFDQFGSLVNPNLGTTPGLMVVVAVPNNSTPIDGTKRCAIVSTILGSTRIGQGKYDANSNPIGCL